MSVSNAQISSIFDRLADLLEIDGASPFRIRAYRNAARTIESMPQSIANMVEDGKDLTELPAIGGSLAEKIREIATTGHLAQLDHLTQRMPAALTELLRVPGLGPKRAAALYRDLGIDSFDALKKAAEEHRLREVEGFGPKLEAQILEHLEQVTPSDNRVGWLIADQIGGLLVAYLRELDAVELVAVAGSYRRRQATVGDLDVVVASEAGPKVMDHFLAYREVDEITSAGETRSSVILKVGMQVDIRVVSRASYGAALHYFTGSKAHSVALRGMAQKRNLKINEYGVYRGDEPIAGATEEQVYESLGLPYIEPELRENRGEIEAALEGRLPSLVRDADIRGDLQIHTEASDGQLTLTQMARAAEERGYEYLAITDHSKYIGVTNGLDPDRLAEQAAEIDRFNKASQGIHLLKGCEVDILEDGSLALPDEALAKLDIALCAVHSHFALTEKVQTERVLKAIRNPYCDILAHPTGRLIGSRPPIKLDMERIIREAIGQGCTLEVNAQPDRLDLEDIYCQMAKEAGAQFVISTDSHHAKTLAWMALGVGQARRGWLEAHEVLNALPLDQLLKRLRRSRRAA